MQHKVLNSVCLTLWSRLKFGSEEVIHGHAVLCTGEKHLKGHSWFWGPHVKKDIVNKAAGPWRVPSRDLKRHQLIWCLGNAGRDLFVCLFVCFLLLSHVQLFVTPWTVSCQASLSFTVSWSLLKLMSIEIVMPSNHLFLCLPLLPLPSIFPSVRFFSNKSAHRIG